jgi:trimeric autotransporter adhesin
MRDPDRPPAPTRRLTRRLRRAVTAGVALAGGLALVPSAHAAPMFTWSGQQVTNSAGSWSDADNWGGSSLSGSSSEDFTFPWLGNCPNTDACYAAHNDLTGITATQLTIDGGSPYSIGGHGLTLTGGIVMSGTTLDQAGSPQISTPLTLGANQTWSLSSPTGAFDGLQIAGAVTGSGHSLGVGLNGALLDLQADTEVGPFTAVGTDPSQTGYDADGNGELSIDAGLNGSDNNPVTVSDLFVREGAGTGPVSVGPFTAQGVDLDVGEGGGGTTGGLTVTGPASIDADSQTTFFVGDPGPTPGADYGQISASDDVTLGGGLSLVYDDGSGSCPSFTAGSFSDTIVQSTDTISGTFTDLPSGSIVDMDCFDQSTQTDVFTPVRIRYHDLAGTVTASSLGTTTTALSASPSAASTNQPVTLTATVAQAAGSPDGTVEFDNGVEAIPGCAAQPVTAAATTGTATCTTTFDAADGADLTAAFTPSSADAGYAPSDSTGDGATPPLTLTIGSDPTATALGVSAATVASGASVTFTATVSPADAGPAAPSGEVDFLDGTTPVACHGTTDGFLVAADGSDQATCTTTLTAAGAHRITAQYDGDEDFVASSSAAQTVTVPAPAGAPAPTPTNPTSPPTTTTPGPAPGPGRPGSGTARLGTLRVTGTRVSAGLSCPAGGPSCRVRLQLVAERSVTVRRDGHRRTERRSIVLGSRTVTLAAGAHRTVALTLDAAGRRRLAAAHRLSTRLQAVRTVGGTRTVAARTVTFHRGARRA